MFWCIHMQSHNGMLVHGKLHTANIVVWPDNAKLAFKSPEPKCGWNTVVMRYWCVVTELTYSAVISQVALIPERGYEEVDNAQDSFLWVSFRSVSEVWLATALAVFLCMNTLFSLLHVFVHLLDILCIQYRRDLVNISKHCTLTHEEAFLIAGIDLCQSSLQLYCSLSLRRKHRWERQHLRLGMMFLWYHSESECAHSCCLLASLCHWIFKLYLMKKCQCSEWSWYYFSV